MSFLPTLRSPLALYPTFEFPGGSDGNPESLMSLFPSPDGTVPPRTLSLNKPTRPMAYGSGIPFQSYSPD